MTDEESMKLPGQRGWTICIVDNTWFFRAEGTPNVYNFNGIFFPYDYVEFYPSGGIEYLGLQNKCAEWRQKIDAKFPELTMLLSRFDTLDNLKRSISLGGWYNCQPIVYSYDPDKVNQSIDLELQKRIRELEQYILDL